jgi:hypothetical protein
MKIDATASGLAQSQNTPRTTIPVQSQKTAAAPVEADFGLSMHVDAGPSMDEYMQLISSDSIRLNATFETVATRYEAAMKNVLAQRPDIADRSFDFTSTEDGLQVASDTMDRQDMDWLQQQLNADPDLVSSAHAFNELVVKRYHTDQERVDTTGEVYTHTRLRRDRHTAYDYRDLADTVDRSVKFVALMEDAQGQARTMNAQNRGADGYEPQQYAKAADLVQGYLDAHITHYGKMAADGSVSVTESVGSIVSMWL